MVRGEPHFHCAVGRVWTLSWGRAHSYNTTNVWKEERDGCSPQGNDEESWDTLVKEKEPEWVCTIGPALILALMFRAFEQAAGWLECLNILFSHSSCQVGEVGPRANLPGVPVCQARWVCREPFTLVASLRCGHPRRYELSIDVLLGTSMFGLSPQACWVSWMKMGEVVLQMAREDGRKEQRHCVG